MDWLGDSAALTVLLPLVTELGGPGILGALLLRFVDLPEQI